MTPAVIPTRRFSGTRSNFNAEFKMEWKVFIFIFYCRFNRNTWVGAFSIGIHAKWLQLIWHVSPFINLAGMRSSISFAPSRTPPSTWWHQETDPWKPIGRVFVLPTCVMRIVLKFFCELFSRIVEIKIQTQNIEIFYFNYRNLKSSLISFKMSSWLLKFFVIKERFFNFYQKYFAILLRHASG